MIAHYKILHLEDFLPDAELAARELIKQGFSFEHHIVETESEFLDELTSWTPDIILCDNSLRGYSASAAIKEVKIRMLDIPFILLTATVDEQLAMQIINEGGDDYLFKDRISRLPKAIINSVEKFRTKKAELHALQAIKESELRYRSIFEFSMDGMLLIDASDKIFSANAAAGNIFQVRPQKLSSVHFCDLIDVSDPRFKKIMQRRSVKGRANGEIKLKRLDGTLFEGEISIADFSNAIGNASASVIVRDIEERHTLEVEKQKITEDLIQQNKEHEQFNYIVSHNLRAPVVNIIGACNIFNDLTITETDRSILLNGINSSVLKLDEVIKDLNEILNIKKNLKEVREVVNLQELVDAIKIILRETLIATNCVIDCDFSAISSLFTIKVYLQSIFYNIISNSLKYRQRNESPIISVKTEINSKFIKVIFTDNGIGIDLKKRSNEVFKLYKRFHLEVEGKGIGLFMTKAQVERLGGTISLVSEINMGTSVTISFKR